MSKHAADSPPERSKYYRKFVIEIPRCREVFKDLNAYYIAYPFKRTCFFKQDTSSSATLLKEKRAIVYTDTDTDILPGLTRKCNVRSKFR
jgi:hypothetical protein